MSDRFEIERAVQESTLTAHVRWVVTVLITRADWPGGIIPAEHTPSLSRLATLTGLARSTVAASLNDAEQTGWVERHRPDPAAARSRRARTRYRITRPRLVRVPDQSTSPGDGPVRDTDHNWSATRTTTSPGDGHKPDRYQTKPDRRPSSPAHGPDPDDAAARLVADRTGATPAEAAAIVDQYRHERSIRGAATAYIRAIPPHELQTRLDAIRADRVRADRAAFNRWRTTQPDCTHGVPAGHEPEPGTGWVACPIHRNRTA